MEPARVFRGHVLVLEGICAQQLMYAAGCVSAVVTCYLLWHAVSHMQGGGGAQEHSTHSQTGPSHRTAHGPLIERKLVMLCPDPSSDTDMARPLGLLRPSHGNRVGLRSRVDSALTVEGVAASDNQASSQEGLDLTLTCGNRWSPYS